TKRSRLSQSSRTSNHPLLGARPTAMVIRANLQMFISTGCICIIDGYIKAFHKQKVNRVVNQVYNFLHTFNHIRCKSLIFLGVL
ncbi:hypothetical protein KBT16_24585, partial [Nostoc sp. CCCryo 231-06]|nr:hypothetical protein [Nostoc sp. CCCryo 231-06]